MYNGSVSNGKEVYVGIGNVEASGDQESTLVATGIGSCVCVCMHDPIAKIGGMAHVLLPGDGSGADEGDMRYATVAIPALLKKMKELGALERRINASIAGGACMIKTSVSEFSKIGGRNVVAARKILKDMRLKERGSHVGGEEGRTIRLYVKTGQVTVAVGKIFNEKAI